MVKKEIKKGVGLPEGTPKQNRKKEIEKAKSDTNTKFGEVVKEQFKTDKV